MEFEQLIKARKILRGWTEQMEATPLLLSGVPGSPYTRKMVALLRYRRMAYRLVSSSTGVPGLPMARPLLLPTFYLPGPDGSLQAVTDSTPLVRRFEAECAGRSVIPADPALALVDALLEDFGDEWLTKAMFHYRWHHAADIDKAARSTRRCCWPMRKPSRRARRRSAPRSRVSPGCSRPSPTKASASAGCGVTTRLWMAWHARGSTGPWPARAANACSPNADPNGTAIL